MTNKFLECNIEKRKIEKWVVFIRLLEKLERSKISEEVKKQIRIKIFIVLNRLNYINVNKNTKQFTSMIGDKVSRVLKLNELDTNTIKEILLINWFSEIIWVFNSKWFPNNKELIIEFLEIFKNTNWKINFKLLKSITWMLSWKWIPKKESLKKFINIFKQSNWYINYKLLRSITWMLNWRWIPDNIDTINEFINIFRISNDEIDYKLLNSITWRYDEDESLIVIKLKILLI